MMPNFLVMLLAAFVPVLLGFVWYHPKIFGNAWAQAAEMTEEKMKGGKMGLIFFLSFVLSFFLAMAVNFIVIHQSHMFSTLANEPGMMEQTGEAWTYFQDFMTTYGDRFRTFKHGMFHGVLDGIMFATPILAINAMFERKSFKYVAVNAGYWILTLGVMGGIICQYA